MFNCKKKKKKIFFSVNSENSKISSLKQYIFKTEFKVAIKWNFQLIVRFRGKPILRTRVEVPPPNKPKKQDWKKKYIYKKGSKPSYDSKWVKYMRLITFYRLVLSPYCTPSTHYVFTNGPTWLQRRECSSSSQICRTTCHRDLSGSPAEVRYLTTSLFSKYAFIDLHFLHMLLCFW